MNILLPCTSIEATLSPLHVITLTLIPVRLLTVIHCLLTHSFQITNDNGFQFYGYPLGRLRTTGNVRVIMSVLYPPTCSLVEMHLDVTPAMDIDVQLVTCLLSLMTDSCPERFFCHLCCDVPDDLFL